MNTIEEYGYKAAIDHLRECLGNLVFATKQTQQTPHKPDCNCECCRAEEILKGTADFDKPWVNNASR